MTHQRVHGKQRAVLLTLRGAILVRWALAGYVLIFVLAGCSRPKSSSKQILRVGVGTDLKDLDPQTNSTAPAGPVLNALFEGLVSLDKDGLSIAPGVAEGWDISDDGLTYTFHLRPNARWSNDDPVVAADFVRSWQRLLDPELGAELAHLAYKIEGAQIYRMGRMGNFDAVGVHALDEHTLVVRITAPSAHFLTLLARYPFLPVHIPSIASTGGLQRAGTSWTQPEKFVCNGPFQLAAWSRGKEIILKKNPHYWDASIVTLDELHFLLIENQEREEEAYRDNKLDVTRTVPPSKVAYYQKGQPHTLRVQPRLGLVYLELNSLRPPFSDVLVRRAFALAVDREAVIASITGQGLKPALALTQPGVDGYIPTLKTAKNIEEARRLLAHAGYENGKGMPPVRFLFNSNERNQEVAEALRAIWQQGLGVRIELISQPFKTFLENRHSGQAEIIRVGWQPFVPDQIDVLGLITAESVENMSGWSNSEYDAQYFRALRSIKPAERFAAFARMDEIVAAEVPVIPLYYDSRINLVRPTVKDWSSNVSDFQVWKRVSIGP
ncbi:MAG TPA: peptide ABC transporter substrate-binding protein [Opitutaceae bacterium]|nr:peptide ABC transporter substrate-binding protein [Opitutaceae bacterium]